MTKEQEEAIKYLEESILVYKNTLPKISTTLETVLSMLKEKDKDIAKKDRIIDEMAEKLNQAYCDENDYWDWFEERFGRIPDGSYAKKIKQYFKRKVEE